MIPEMLALTFPENWPPTLTLASLPGVSVTLSDGDAETLGSQSALFREIYGDTRRIGFSKGFEKAIAKALDEFPEGVMPRIGMCSWKASTVVHAPCRSVADVMRVITANDPRVAQAIFDHGISKRRVVLHLRAWRDIPDWAEFRLFVKRRRLVGVSQYAWQQTFPQIAAQHAAIVTAVNTLLRDIWDDLHMDDVVIDVCVLPEGDGLKAWLIELNPFDRRSDACLYRWENGGDFDGGFRYNRYQDAAAFHGAPHNGSASGSYSGPA